MPLDLPLHMKVKMDHAFLLQRACSSSEELPESSVKVGLYRSRPSVLETVLDQVPRDERPSSTRIHEASLACRIRQRRHLQRVLRGRSLIKLSLMRGEDRAAVNRAKTTIPYPLDRIAMPHPSIAAYMPPRRMGCLLGRGGLTRVLLHPGETLMLHLLTQSQTYTLITIPSHIVLYPISKTVKLLPLLAPATTVAPLNCA